MDYLFDFITKAIPVTILEFSAVIAGIFYLKKSKKDKKSKYFVFFLGFTFINELIGFYAPLAYFSEYKYFSFVKDTVFYNNVWLYNMFILISISFYVLYFNSYLSSDKIKRKVYYFLLLYLIINITNFIFSDMFFTGYSVLAITMGTLFLLFSVFLFYLDLLKTDKIFSLKRFLPFYMSIGVLVFYLCVTPLFTFPKYFNALNDLYVNLRTNVLLFANIIMYGTFITGFIVCAKSSPNKDELLN